MNERIQKLAEQAGIYKLNLSDETEYWIMEKFAELIVQECIRVPYTMWHNAELGSEAVKIEHKIKKHFGL